MMNTSNISSKTAEESARCLNDDDSDFLEQQRQKKKRSSKVSTARSIKAIITEITKDIKRHQTRHMPNDSTFNLFNWTRKDKALRKVLLQHEEELQFIINQDPELFI